MELNQAFKLRGHVMHYPWGRLGEDSLVFRLAAGSESSSPYAELWFGTHPRGSSLVELAEGELLLGDFIASAPAQILGACVIGQFGERLPFLVKILSVRTALSIQTHPSLDQAVQLNARDPINYPDAYHKPELAIALTKLSLVCGFRTLSEISNQIIRTPALGMLLSHKLKTELARKMIGKDKRSRIRAQLYAAILRTPVSLLKRASTQLQNELEQLPELSLQEKWALKLSRDYPDGDVGLFSLLVMEGLTLNPGEAFFIPANMPHAYLEGELLECMASSDNVVRGGLTNKYCDIDTLLEIVDYAGEVPPLVTIATSTVGSRYVATAAEFVVDYICAPSCVQIALEDSLELLLSIDGEGFVVIGAEQYQILSGSSVLIPACVSSYSLTVTAGGVYRIRSGAG